MPSFAYLCFLLAAFSTLVSSKPTHSQTTPAVYSNCSGNSPVALPNTAASVPFFKPQIRINPLEINKNGTGWEEWLLLGQTRLADGSEIIYSCKWALGDPTSANVSHQTFVAWAYFPNGTFFHQTVDDIFVYEEYADGGFKYPIADNHFTWDPVHEYWNTSVNAGGWIIETYTKRLVPPSALPFPRDSHETIPCSVEPDIPFAPSYKSVPGQLSEGFFSRLDISRGHTNGYMAFPWGFNLTVMSVASLKHSWSNKVMADVLSAYVRGSTFVPEDTPSPISTVSWYQAWDPSGKGPSVFSLPDGVPRRIHIERMSQRSTQCNSCSSQTTLPTIKCSGSRSPTHREFSASSRSPNPCLSLSPTTTPNSLFPCADLEPISNILTRG